MADLTAETYYRLSKADREAITLWLFEHGIDGLHCSHITMDEGWFDAHLYEFHESETYGHQIAVDTFGEPIRTVKRIKTHQPLEGNVVRRWLQLERDRAAA